MHRYNEATVIQHRTASSARETSAASLYCSRLTKCAPSIVRNTATAESLATVTISHIAVAAPVQARPDACDQNNYQKILPVSPTQLRSCKG